jgi:tRNA-2-methylthio-N6-dimethylallyladenosine synthase
MNLTTKKQLSKRFYIRTFGCQMNVRDSEIIAGLLRAGGYQLAAEAQEADIVILNTCSVRQHAEERVWSEIGRLRRKRKEGGGGTKGERPIIGVIGCMAQNYKDEIFRRAPNVDFVVGPSDIDKIPGIIDRLVYRPSSIVHRNLYETKIWETDGDSRPEEIYHTGFRQDKEHAYAVISEGCSNFCSYCVVPYVRGALRNRKHQDILREIKEATEKGITKITLLGQNVNAYQDNGVDFAGLLQRVEAIEGLKAFSFVTSHPKDISVKLFKVMADCAKLEKYLHLPVQSGSDRILGLMNRGYTSKFYLDLADNYRKIVKDGALTTDIIVGFPTEAEKDFRDTCELVKNTEFDAAFIFKYSPRRHTKAAELPDDVGQEEKEKRHGLILELQKKISKNKIC